MRLVFAVVAVGGLLLDQLTKIVVVRFIDPTDPPVLLGGLLTLRLIRNPGAAFSLGENLTIVFALLAVAVVAFVLVRLAPTIDHPGWAVALGLLVAGVSGNLMDRIFRAPAFLHGHVVDFFQLPHFAIFNVADVCITSAAVLIMILAVVRGVGIDGVRYTRTEAASGGAGPGRTGQDAAEQPDRELTVTESRVLLVPEGLEGERVDTAVARMLGLSRTRVADLAATGGVLVDGSVAAKSDRVRAGAMLEVSLGEPRTAVVRAVEAPGLTIVYDDDDIVVVDKPVGVAAHPSVGWSGPTVLGHLAAAGFRVSTSGVPERQGIVQRLDVGTSGLMVVAKSEIAYTVLKQAFRTRTVDKTYHALVQGHPDPFVGTIDAPIGRHPSAEYKMAITASGRHSVTHYDTVQAYVGTTLLEVHLETGRTHQIRVHLAAIHHPCVGDPMYGGDPVLAARLGLERQWLHAVRLGFTHPVRGEYVTFESGYPADLQGALDVVAWA